MTPARWRQIESLYDQALEIDPPRRVEFLDQACGGDVDLRRDLERLVSEKPQRGSFLEKPAIKEIAEEFAATMGSSWVGVQIGNYQLVSLAGAGGMGEVYRARDTKLKRDVAIKILPDEFSSDPDRVSRFQREAELLASLNHPNIAAIYDLEEADSHRFLILELVEGETLADRIKRGPIPAEEALRIALQIAEALEAAHEKSVIHRDLKPANIKVTDGGKVKVLDFGLAKALLGDAGVNLSNSPTVSMAATQQGVMLGTAAYMSPEQARGQAVDRRADVWAFGCVLFEMLSGRPTFGGKTLTDVIASVLKTTPDWNSLPANLHPRILHLLERCLEKEPQDRSQGLADARFEINKVLANPGTGLVKPPIQTRAGLRSRLPWIAAILVAAVLAWIPGRTVKPTEPARVLQFPLSIPEDQPFTPTYTSSVAMSPDGTRIAYADGGSLYLGDTGGWAPRAIPGSQSRNGIGQPVFSRDGQWLVYGDGALKKIPVSGGTAVTLIEGSSLGVSWTANDTILFASTKGILEIPATGGGTPSILIKAAEGERLSSPEMLPGGKSLLFSATTAGWDSAQIFVQSLKSGERNLVWKGGGDPRYIPTGHIVYAQGNGLFALPFDIETLKVGVPTPVVEGVRRSRDGVTDTANYDISDTGSLIYVPDTTPPPADNLLALVDLSGRKQKLNVSPKQYRSPRLSPDGLQLAVQTIDKDGLGSIWIYPLSGQSEIRPLTQTGSSIRPIWTPDAKSVTFACNSDGVWGIYSQLADGSAAPVLLTAGEQGIQLYPESWSPDGRTLSFVNAGIGGGGDWSIWTFSLDSRKAEIFHNTPTFNDFGSSFSPDGNWLAYTVAGPNPAGIRVQPFPPKPGVIHMVTQTRETWPIWSRQNRLFFRQGVDVQQPVVRLMAVDVSTKGTLAFHDPLMLPIQDVLMFRGFRDYDIAPDGKHFVMIVPVADSSAKPPPARARIEVVVNWFEQLKARVLPR